MAPPWPISDQQIRKAAELSLAQIVQARGTNVINWRDVAEGFEVGGQRVYFTTKAQGIFKPKELGDGAALSVRQAKPSRVGRPQPYDDQDLGDGLTAYRLERSGRDNHLLEEAFRQGVPLIFFRGVADSTYEALFPVFIRAIDNERGEALLAFEGDRTSLGQAQQSELVCEPIERSYSLGVRKTRNHQQAFRRRVLLAYGLRCAITGLPVQELLEAAHIKPDHADGEASVCNGLALSRLHHTAYELNFLGIDSDLRIHVSKALKRTKDGPLLKHGLLDWDGQKLRPPNFKGHYPNSGYLAERFAEFKTADV